MVRNNRSEKGIRNTNPAQRNNRRQNNAPETVEEGAEEAAASTESAEAQETNQVETVNEETVPVNIVVDQPEVDVEVQVEASSSTGYTTRSGRRTKSKVSASEGNKIEKPTKKVEKPKGKRKKSKGYFGKGVDSSDESSGDEFQPYDVFDNPGPSNSRARFTRSGKKLDEAGGEINPPTGVTFCNTCNTRFVMKPTTLPDENGNYKCGNCDINLKAKTREAKRSKMIERDTFLKGNVSWFDKDKIPTLQMMCINLIGDNPDMVQGLSGLSLKTTTQIIRILSKHRVLTQTTLPLFLAPMSDSLSLFDCSKLDETSLSTIATTGSELTELKLLFCGQMSDPVIQIYSEHLVNITDFTIHGAFLVTDPAFANLFNNIGSQLQYLSIIHSPRLHLETMQAIGKNCTNLEYLNLRDCEKLDDDCINLLLDSQEDNAKPTLKSLKGLDLSSYSNKITESNLVRILKVIGPNLTTLKLNNWTELTDDVFLPAVQYLPNITHLELSHCEQLTGASLIPLLEKVGHISNYQQGLRVLNLAFNSIEVDNQVLLTALKYHAKSLLQLDISGLDSLTDLGLREGFTSYPPTKLQLLNLSWVRATSDPLLTDILPNLVRLQELRVWGAHQVTENLPKFVVDVSDDIDDSFLVGKGYIKVVGRECDTL